MKKAILFFISFLALPAQAVLYKQNMDNIGPVTSGVGLLNYNMPQSFQGIMEKIKQQQAENSAVLKLKNTMILQNALNQSDMLKAQAEQMLRTFPAGQARQIENVLKTIKRQMNELRMQQQRAAQAIQYSADRIR